MAKYGELASRLANNVVATTAAAATATAALGLPDCGRERERETKTSRQGYLPIVLPFPSAYVRACLLALLRVCVRARLPRCCHLAAQLAGRGGFNMREKRAQLAVAGSDVNTLRWPSNENTCRLMSTGERAS